MTLLNQDKSEIKQYLLGVLSEEAQERVEKRLLIEEAFFEELLLVEDELIDHYINGDISGEDRERFERHFLSTPERQQKLRFARALDRYVTEKSVAALGESASELAPPPAAAIVPPTRLTWAERFRAFWSGQRWALGSAAAALVVVAAIALVFWLRSTPSPRTFATVTLNASASNRAEGVEAGKVKLQPGIDALRINLKLPEGAASAARYRAELENEDGGIEPLEVAGRDSQSVTVIIPAARLVRGQYAVTLFPIKSDGTEQPVNDSYFFIIE